MLCLNLELLVKVFALLQSSRKEIGVLMFDLSQMSGSVSGIPIQVDFGCSWTHPKTGCYCAFGSSFLEQKFATQCE